MYPDMTSPYSATVLDSMSYCQEYGGIIVVQFDEDEPYDVTGLISKCHIPSLVLLHPCPSNYIQYCLFHLFTKQSNKSLPIQLVSKNHYKNVVILPK